MGAADGSLKVQKTVRIPKRLYEEAEQLVRRSSRRESINEFIVKSMRLRASLLRRKEIDAQFALMASDSRYQKQAQSIAEEFEYSDWESLKTMEG
ncbi:MAG TPA: hypothetical protein VKM93_10755 [Terriglobia bacterium]|nr:hypothetical protein [Terriglobia bacterium]